MCPLLILGTKYFLDMRFEIACSLSNPNQLIPMKTKPLNPFKLKHLPRFSTNDNEY